MKKDELEGEIHVNNQYCQEERVKRHDPEVAECTLGVHVAVDGNMEEQKKQLGKSTQEWISQITSSFLYRSEVLLVLMTTITRTWLYPLQATTFSQEDCDDIARPLYAEILPRIGANRKIPRVCRYAPKSLMGLGLPDIYVMQGTAQIKAIIYHMNKGTMVGKLVLTEMEAASVELGINTCIFQLDYDIWFFLLTDCWLKSTWRFCSDNKIRLQGPCKLPPLQCKNDGCIMDLIIKKYGDTFTKGEIATINRCRLHLQVLFLSDITTGEGDKVTTRAMNGIQDRYRISSWAWPYQPRPLRKEWVVWQKAITLLVTNGVSTSRKLHQPLGKWTADPHQCFIWFYSPSHNSVYRKINVGWRQYEKVDRYRTAMDRVCFSRGRFLCTTPDDLCRTGIQLGPNAKQIWIDGSTLQVAPAVQVINNSHWIFSTAKQLSYETYGLIKNTYFLATEEVIKEFFNQGQRVIVSDGSYNPNYRKGTAAVIIESTIGVQLIKSYVLTPGVDSDINAYRSELIGIMVGCLILKMYSDRYGIVDKKVQFGCDNEKAVQLGLCSKIFSPVMTKHVDIIWEIQSLCRTTKMILEAKHVKGHQSIFQCERSQLAKMNSEADALAKRYLRFYIDSPEINISQHLGGSHCSVWCGDRKIVKDIDTEMTRYIHGNKLKAHISQRKGWSKETLECVDWETMSSVCKSDNCSDTIWKMKIASGFFPVATRMVLNKQWDS